MKQSSRNYKYYDIAAHIKCKKWVADNEISMPGPPQQTSWETMNFLLRFLISKERPIGHNGHTSRSSESRYYYLKIKGEHGVSSLLIILYEN